jgi:hypothetical protein
LDKNISKAFIQISSSSTTALILSVNKGDGIRRLIINYRAINKGTIKNRYPLLLLQDMLMYLSRAKWFTKLDIRSAYNLIYMAKGKEWNTVFCTWYRLFKSLVMPFSLTNSMVRFQNYINNILAPYWDHFCTAYLDNVLIYSDTFEDTNSTSGLFWMPLLWQTST